MQEKIRILMAGPDLKEQGGMGTVQQHIIKYVQPYADLNHIATWNGSNGKPSKWQTAIVFTQAVYIFLKTLLTDHIDIVHLHVSERGSVLRIFTLMLLANLFRKPVLLHTHGCEFHIFYENLPRPIKQMVKLGIQSSFLISLSDSWETWYQMKCGIDSQHSFVLKNPVEFPQDTLLQTNNSQVVEFLFLGKLNQRKGIFDILQAFARLDQELQNQAKIIFAGTGSEDELWQLARKLNVEQRLSLPGWINAQQRDQFMMSSDIFLLPSYNEGLPMALLEAMAWGLPAITTPVGGIPEVIESHCNGILVEPGQINQLTEAMTLLIQQPNLRKRLGSEARETIRPLSIEKYIDALLKIYSEVTNVKLTFDENKTCTKDKVLNV